MAVSATHARKRSTDLLAERDRCDDAADTAQADDERRREGALRLARDVVRLVGDDGRDVGLAAEEPEERPSVATGVARCECLSCRISATQEPIPTELTYSEAYTDDGDAGLGENERCALVHPVREPGRDETEDDREYVRRRRLETR